MPAPPPPTPSKFALIYVSLVPPSLLAGRLQQMYELLSPGQQAAALPIFKEDIQDVYDALITSQETAAAEAALEDLSVPTYLYECPIHGEFEVSHRVTEKREKCEQTLDAGGSAFTECDEPVKRLIAGGVTASFKGGGWTPRFHGG